jgi:hypothetical protein
MRSASRNTVVTHSRASSDEPQCSRAMIVSPEKNPTTFRDSIVISIFIKVENPTTRASSGSRSRMTMSFSARSWANCSTDVF